VPPPRKSPASPTLCYVTDRLGLTGRKSGTLLDLIATASAAGVDWIQIREKDLTARECSSLVRRAIGRASSETKIIVNDRLDVAIAEHAAGVHLGESSLPVQDVRAWMQSHPEVLANEGFFVGVSCHSEESAKTAARNGAGYIFFGPVFATPSKAGFGGPQGLERLAGVCRAVSVPVLAIGGITLENARACLDAGAAGIAAIRLFQDAADLSAVVSKLRAATR
jgi:thiamine-phosphate pyrophosphorylase